MHLDEKKGLSKARFARANDCLNSAKILLAADDYKGAANRSYYAVFHAMRSVLALDGIDMKHHSGIMSEFRRLYIKTGLLDKSLSPTITALFNIRQESDYDDFFVISKVEVVEQIANAETFLNEVQKYLDTQ